jgi:hypothetical protein
MSPEDRKGLQAAFEHIMAGVAQLLDGALEGDTSEFEARGTFH